MLGIQDINCALNGRFLFCIHILVLKYFSDVMSSKHKAQKLALTKKDSLRDLGLTISNVKDWEGYRLLRTKKRTELETP